MPLIGRRDRLDVELVNLRKLDLLVFVICIFKSSSRGSECLCTLCRGSSFRSLPSLKNLVYALECDVIQIDSLAVFNIIRRLNSQFLKHRRRFECFSQGKKYLEF